MLYIVHGFSSSSASEVRYFLIFEFLPPSSIFLASGQRFARFPLPASFFIASQLFLYTFSTMRRLDQGGTGLEQKWNTFWNERVLPARKFVMCVSGVIGRETAVSLREGERNFQENFQKIPFHLEVTGRETSEEKRGHTLFLI